MSVSRILAAKGREVATISATRSLGEAARRLSERGIGALIVRDEARPVAGIVSERDIVRAVAAHGAGALDQPVARFMTTNVVTCRPEAPVHEIMQAMTEGKFRHMPVMEDGALAGIVSIGDVVKHRLAEIEAEARAIRDYIATA